MKLNGKQTLLCSLLCIILSCFTYTAPVQAADDEALLAIFWNENGGTEVNTVFYSEDAVNFYEIGKGFLGFRDTDIMAWNNGYIVQSCAIDRKNHRAGTKMVYTRDFVNYSPVSYNYVDLSQFENFYGLDVNKYDVMAADSIIEGNTMYTLVSVGYYAAAHGGDHADDIFGQYLLTGTLDPEMSCQNGYRELGVKVNYTSCDMIKTPCVVNRTKITEDHIDGSLYKEDGWYYLTIKENGITNEIFKIKDLADVSNPKAWTMLTDDAVSGCEGATLLKFKDNYYMFTDKLGGYPVLDSDKLYVEGMQVTKASTKTTGKLDEYTGWLEDNTKELVLYNSKGKKLANSTARHGSVIVISGNAKADIQKLPSFQKPAKSKITWAKQGWYKLDKYCYNRTISGNKVYYWYENDVRQGLDNRGKEIYDPQSNAWYWLDSIYKGKMACGTNDWDPVSGDLIRSSYDKGDYEVAQPWNQQLYNEYGEKYYNSIDPDINSTWKWVRYNSDGQMIKGEYYNPANGKYYYYDEITGAMYKGRHDINSGTFYYDLTTGTKYVNCTVDIDGNSFTFNEFGLLVSGDANKLPVHNYHDPYTEHICE